MNQDDRLNAILEESLRSVFSTHVPNIIDNVTDQETSGSVFTNFLRDLSLNPIGHVIQETTDTDAPTYTYSNSSSNSYTADIPSSTNQPAVTVNTNTNPDVSHVPRQISNEQYLELFDKFSTQWFRYTDDYHQQMRLYQESSLQMIRVGQTLARILQVSLRPMHQAALSYNTPPPITSLNQPSNLMPPHVRDFLSRNGFELNMNGFSIPLPTLRTEVDDPITFPTIQQVLSGTEQFIYNEDNAARVHDTRCPISLDDFQPGEELCQIKSCRHIFKWESLQNWFSRNSHCPVCRYDIRSTSISDQNDI
jgi:hypothetical protein